MSGVTCIVRRIWRGTREGGRGRDSRSDKRVANPARFAASGRNDGAWSAQRAVRPRAGGQRIGTRGEAKRASALPEQVGPARTAASAAPSWRSLFDLPEKEEVQADSK